MQQKKNVVLACGLAVLAGAPFAHAAATIDGTLDSSYGTVITTQSETSNVGQAPNSNADSQRTPAQNQLSNAYGQIDTVNNQLDVFLGGAVNLNDEYLHILIDANPTTGVASLNSGTHSAAGDTGNVSNFPGFGAANSSGDGGNGGNLDQTKFDAGFRPETLLTFQFNGGNIIYDDNLLTGTEIKDDYGADPQNGPVTRGPAAGDPAGGVNFTVAVNNAIGNAGTLETATTAGSATTGFEIALNLSDLDYVAGSNVGVEAFFTQGSGTSMTNQVLAANPGYDGDSYANYNFDFTANQGPGGHNAPGDQYFIVSATPEPTSLGLLGLAAAPMIFGRRRKTQSVTA